MRQIVLIHVIVLTILIFCQSLISRSEIAKDHDVDRFNDRKNRKPNSYKSNLIKVPYYIVCDAKNCVVTLYLSVIF